MPYSRISVCILLVSHTYKYSTQYAVDCISHLNSDLTRVSTLPGRLQDQDPCFRAVVFSQFTSFLDLIGTALEREHITFCRFDGTMDMKKKSAAVAEFKAPSRRPKVLIISLKAGGVGLNVCVLSLSFVTER